MICELSISARLNLVMEPAKNKKETAKFCGNILVRKTKRRSFLAKSLFEGVFGVLTEVSFEYYHSSAQWVSLNSYG